MSQDIWSGVGPRQGQFAFIIHPKEAKVKVLHVDGDLIKRLGPSPTSSHWFLKHHDLRPFYSAYFREWPVRLTDNTGELPEPVGWRKGYAPNFPQPLEGEVFTPSNPAHHPYNEATLQALVDMCGTELIIRLDATVWFLQEKKLKEDVQSALTEFRDSLRASFRRFEQIRYDLAPHCVTFDHDNIGESIKALCALDFGETRYHSNDDEGYAVVSVTKGKLADYLSGYLNVLAAHAKDTYLENPETFAEPARERFEALWAFDALHERGGMSHPPKGFIYRPHGPNSPNEVLLELPTSNLIGWIFGDMYSLVLTIAREDLAAGNLDNVMVDITN